MVWRVEQGDSRVLLRQLAPDSVDAVVCDPPYELGFMGRSWDRSGIANDPDLWTAVLDACKPGAHLLAFGGSRTFHRMICAVEDAGWQVRDCLSWLYGSGFPKSLDVSKAIDKAAGVEREDMGPGRWAHVKAGGTWVGTVYGNEPEHSKGPRTTAPATDDARRWQGWGTALKPAWEPIVLARKPLAGTVAQNVAAHGTGGLNVDGCRIGAGLTVPGGGGGAKIAPGGVTSGFGGGAFSTPHTDGRWPANVLLDPEAGAQLDAQSGISTATAGVRRNSYTSFDVALHDGRPKDVYSGHHDSGGASRFFYCAKASRSEREAGLGHLPPQTRAELTGRKAGSAGLVGSDGSGNNPYTGANYKTPIHNTHPTVKPIDLIRWLCRLITPPGGLVLDPFCGSGTTGIAAVLEGFGFVGFDLEADHVQIARARIAHWQGVDGITPDEARAMDTDTPTRAGQQLALFGGPECT